MDMNGVSKEIRITEFFKIEYKKLLQYVRHSIEDTADRDSEDIIQDVMINLFNKSDFTVPIENLSAYIYKSLKNRIIDLFRKSGKDHKTNIDLLNMEKYSLANQLPNHPENPVSEMERQESYKKLFEAIDSLNEPERAIIIATEMDEQTFRNLSKKWGIPIGTLLARKSRALKKIKHQLKELKIEK